MVNELQIRPLREYSVDHGAPGAYPQTDVFTGDDYEIRDDRAIFYRTGNIIREYPSYRVFSIVVTPANVG